MKHGVWISLIWMSVALLACVSNNSSPTNRYLAPASFIEGDLIGTWQAIYVDVDFDTISIRADGTYQQVFITAQGYRYENSWNKWRVEKRPSGCIYLHLDDAHYYAGPIEQAERMAQGSNVALKELCEDRFVGISTELILTVTGTSGSTPGVVLVHLKPDADTGDQFFTLVSTSTPVATDVQY